MENMNVKEGNQIATRYVIKRSGKQIPYEEFKIRRAIEAANSEEARPDFRLTDANIDEIVGIMTSLVFHSDRALSVEEIQDHVEREICKRSYTVFLLFHDYRTKHAEKRNKSGLDQKIEGIVEVAVDDATGTVGVKNEEVKQENSNKNPTILSVQRDYMAGEWSRYYTNKYLLSEEITKAHELGLIHFHDADYFAMHMHNCFHSKTRFVTSDGVKSFDDFHDGDKVNVVTKDGKWAEATIRNYGKRKMNEITLSSARSEKTVIATADHRWILKSGEVTTNLKIGDILVALPQMLSVPDVKTPEDAKYFTIGFAIGDGTDTPAGSTRVRLCGNKTKFESIFRMANYHIVKSKVLAGDVTATVYPCFKQRFIESKAWEFLNTKQKALVFLGYYCADGSKKGNRLSTADERLLPLIEETSSLAGYYIASKSTEIRDTEYKKGSLLYSYRFRRSQPENICWKVKDIKSYARGTEYNAWCVEEPTTHSFTLDGGVVTGNCCLINLEDMLQNGTCISGTMIEKPHSFITACTVMSQISAAVASAQYGGQTMTLSHIAPFVDISRQKIAKRLKSEFEEAGVELSDEKFKALVEKEVRKEVESGCQTIQYQLITLSSTNGQAPFITLLMYLDEVPEGQLRDDLAMIIEVMLEQRILGVRDRNGAYITPAFPKLIYVLEEDNIKEGDPYYNLTVLAAKCTAKRMVPDYISEKKALELKGDCYPCMGCRSFLTPDRFTDAGVGNLEKRKNYIPGQHRYYGRFNQGVVTLNLVDVACSSGKDMKKFWGIMEDRLELCHRALRIRHERLLGTPSDVAPILWQDGALARLAPGETIDKLLYNGYSTISLGYAGLAECVYYMLGTSHTSEEGQQFGLKVMQALNDACTRWKNAENIDYSVYGTPLESTTYKFAKCLQRRFGSIPGVTDKNYITNSYHIRVTEEIDAFSKITKEAAFQKLSPGGAISYVEVPNMQNNIQAVLAIMKHIYETILYAELNTKSDYCDACGYDGEIKVIKENGKYMWECPNCKNRDQTKMHVARRTCGYIGTQFWNQGRTQEIAERVMHVSQNALQGTES